MPFPKAEGGNNTATLRKATDNDFNSLYEIYMAKDVLPYMSFEYLSKEEFKKAYEDFKKSGDIYVLVDAEKVVAVRRLLYGSGPQSHIAYFASFAVHPKHRRKGYAKRMHNLLIEEIKTQKPDIKIIQLSQEADNAKAKQFAETLGYRYEFTYRDWLTRDPKNRSDWYVGESFFSLYSGSVQASSKETIDEYKLPALPSKVSGLDANIATAADLKALITLYSAQEIRKYSQYAYASNEEMQKDLEAKIKANQIIIVKDHQQIQLAMLLNYYKYDKYDHVASVSDVTISQKFNPDLLATVLPKVISQLPQKIKKLECLIVEDRKKLINGLRSAGFQYRGTSITTFKTTKDEYKNQSALELNLFNLADAKALAKTQHFEEYISQRIQQFLAGIEKSISTQLSKHDRLSFENFAYHFIKTLFTKKPELERKNLFQTLEKELIKLDPNIQSIFKGLYEYTGQQLYSNEFTNKLEQKNETVSSLPSPSK